MPTAITPPSVTTEPEPTKEQIAQALDLIVSHQYESFTSDLSVARRVWRANRELVEAPVYPEPFRSFLIKTFDADVEAEDEAGDMYEVVFDPEIRQRLLPEARELAKVWLKNGIIKPRSDT
jgi:hypothetical protein